MTATPKRTRRRKARDPQALALSGVIEAMTAAMGHGGLTWLAGRLGMTPSAMRKRLLLPGCGFDAVTMRAVILVTGMRADRHTEPVDSTVHVGGYAIEMRAGQPTWRRA